MGHELHAAIVVRLPDDAQELAKSISAVTQAWATMLKAIEAAAPEATLAINQTRTRSNGNPKRSRKSRTVAPKGEPEEAA